MQCGGVGGWDGVGWSGVLGTVMKDDATLSHHIATHPIASHIVFSNISSHHPEAISAHISHILSSWINYSESIYISSHLIFFHVIQAIFAATSGVWTCSTRASGKRTSTTFRLLDASL